MPAGAAMLLAVSAAVAAAGDSPGELSAAAWQALLAGDADAAVDRYDRLIEARPDAAPHLWQRGIALYYAGRYADAAAQFESHRTVNGNDIENPVWHLLCLSRADPGGLDAARKRMLPVGVDRRVPMSEVLDLFAGRGSIEAVERAATVNGSAEARMYADLYLGLYAEATGEAAESLRHIRRAADAPLPGHGMRQIAEAHLRFRTAAGETADADDRSE